ncbi:LPXTG cell wall anchor domain-containing protein [Corynebacterium epidermidicanis]|uniref:LPXTG cell wall anchor domain-containing protein n=1 Tax=Corynebacterium epidermidicanis TaxID=1050174 RepID=UPI0011876FA9|nr:LPXTG cell wall anchor domain-containing protein [Corynebacterium epidermidicanis]
MPILMPTSSAGHVLGINNPAPASQTDRVLGVSNPAPAQGHTTSNAQPSVPQQVELKNADRAATTQGRALANTGASVFQLMLLALATLVAGLAFAIRRKAD